MDKINYLEFSASDFAATKQFFSTAFNWQFTEYGPDYLAFEEDNGMSGGFYRSPECNHAVSGGALTVFLTEDLIASEQRIVNAGGKISTPAFDFPGGRRFHFTDPNGNEFAIWALAENHL